MMDWLNYHHLYYFWTVAREGSVTKAAARLHLAQPTVTAQVRALERSLGQKLFEKRGRGLVLTNEGQLVFRYAEELFSLGQELVKAVRGESLPAAKRFAIGISDALPKITTYLLLRPAITLKPALRLLVRIDKTDRLLAELAVHGLDLVLSDTPLMPSVRLRAFNHLLGETSVTIYGVAALANRLKKGFPESLDRAPMLLQTPNTSLRQSLDQWLDARQIRPQIVGEVEDMAMLQTLGQHGLGVFAAPTAARHDICRQYRVRVIGELPQVRERFYAISVERRITHPAVVAISTAAKKQLFG